MTGVVSDGHFPSKVYLLIFPSLFSLVSLAPTFCSSSFGGLVNRVGEKRILVLGILSVDLSISYVG